MTNMACIIWHTVFRSTVIIQVLIRHNNHSHLLSMCRIIEVLFCLRMRHTSWITTNDVEISTSIHTSFTVPLNLLDRENLNECNSL